MLRITVEHRTPKIAIAGVAVLPGPHKTQLPATLLAALTTLTLLTGTTACSSDKKPKDPKISQASPKTAAPPLQPPPTSKSAIPTAPPISEVEGTSTAQSYFDASKKARSARDIRALSEVETGTLLEISTARLERIVKYGDNIGNDEDLATNSNVHVAPPQSAPPGDTRWLLSMGRQAIGKQSRGSLGILRQEQGVGPWKMSFLAFTDVGKDFPAASQIATAEVNGSGEPSNIYYGEEICRDFASYLDGGSTTTNWGPKAKAVIQEDRNNKHDTEALAKGGSATFKTEIRDGDRVPAWKTSDGGKLVMCTTRSSSNLTAGPTPITVTNSQSFQNLNGRTTKWKTLNVVNVGMTVFKIPATSDSPIDIVADSVRSLSTDGTPA
ncbi:hypothetical protein ACFZBU_19850 [Embleya sp. NPDC008237]|uniref:hypothetical protein n=1 Tax=Embleya sp. NPDC008237 TaxID=3363978 RepID=UPI0036EACA25